MLGGFELIKTLIITALAVHQATNLVRYSAIFAPLRDRIETGQKVLPLLPMKVNDFIANVVSCGWCLSIHMSWFLLLGAVLPQEWLVAKAIGFLALALAIAQVANLIHVWTGHVGSGVKGS